MSSRLAGEVVLVTGGTGYIGSHACVALAEAGCKVVVLDNLCNSSIGVLDRIAELSGQKPEFVLGDIRDEEALRDVFARFRPSAVLHFAGLKSVGESVAHPERYRDNNVEGTRVLLAAMQDAGVYTIVFSSSATVYGKPQFCPVTEQHPLAATNPYGQNKLDIENLLRAVESTPAGMAYSPVALFQPCRCASQWKDWRRSERHTQ